VPLSPVPTVLPLCDLSLSMIPRPPSSTLFPYTTLFRSGRRFCAFPKSLHLAPLPNRCTSAIIHTNEGAPRPAQKGGAPHGRLSRSEEHTSELQSRFDLVCRLLLEKKNQELLKHEHIQHY